MNLFFPRQLGWLFMLYGAALGGAQAVAKPANGADEEPPPCDGQNELGDQDANDKDLGASWNLSWGKKGSQKGSLAKKPQTKAKPCAKPQNSRVGGQSDHDEKEAHEKDENKKPEKGSIDLPLGFPGWDPEEFDLGFEPLMDQQIGRKTIPADTGERRVNTFAGELGGHFQAEHVPIFTGGFVWDASVILGFARGRNIEYDLSLAQVKNTVTTKEPVPIDKNQLFKRSFVELTQDFYIDWLRPRLTYGLGKIDWDQLPDEASLKSKLMGFGLGVRLPEVLESWAEWHRYTAYYKSEKDPILTETDGSLTLHSSIKNLM